MCLILVDTNFNKKCPFYKVGKCEANNETNNNNSIKGV